MVALFFVLLLTVLSDHLRNEGYECHLNDPKDFSTRPEFTSQSSPYDTNIMIGIHALRTGAFMKGEFVCFRLT